LSNIFLPKEEKFFTLFSFGQHRTIAQERFARQFFARERRKAAGILTDFKVLQRIPDEKFPQSAAVVIVRWCPCAEPFFSVSVRNRSFWGMAQNTSAKWFPFAGIYGIMGVNFPLLGVVYTIFVPLARGVFRFENLGGPTFPFSGQSPFHRRKADTHERIYHWSK
jgi:hypothetical protein